ncbi:hypothetical protein GGI07_001242 [Coemansia sp. Benny D115]|nr:hypothetical protein GGI07_001242 [Coemansia sp. Benny D115]
MEADEWLQLLSQHPIFLEPPKLPSTDAASRSKSSNAIRQERVVVRGTDMYVAVGCEVRWINLKECKDAFIKSETQRLGAGNQAVPKHDAVCNVKWYRLGCEALSFDIHKLVINGNGKLLAVMGKGRVAVVVLPTRAAVTAAQGGSGTGAFSAVRCEDTDGGTQESKWIDCRSMAVGGGSAPATVGMARVVDILWHALSTSDSHLMVLHSGGNLRMFDVSKSVDNPEQTTSMFRSGFAAAQAVSLSMGGAGAAGWARATAYVATNAGAVYALCPLLPRHCCVGRSWLDSLYETAALDVREWQAEEYQSGGKMYSPPELVGARAAVSWLTKMRDLAGDAEHDEVCLDLASVLTQPLAPQGPFLMRPEPASVQGYDSNYDSDSELDDVGDDASAVLRMETPSGLGIVAIAYCDSHVEVFADMEPVIGRWADDNRSARTQPSPVLATLATVDLTISAVADDDFDTAGRPSGAVALIPDPLNGCVFYALHSRGVHQIDLRGVGRLLDRAISEQSEQVCAENSMLKRLASAKPAVVCVAHTTASDSQEHMPVVGAVVVDDIYLSYSLIALVGRSHMIGVSLPLTPEPGADDDVDADTDAGRLDSSPTGKSADAPPRRLDLSANAKDVVYVPRLPTGGYSAPSEQPIFQPRLVLRDDGSGDGMAGDVSEAKLRLLGEVVGQLRAQLSSVTQAHAHMRTHLDLQVQEHRRQHAKLTSVSSGFQKHFDQLRVSQQRITRLRDNASRQAMRVDQMLRQLITHYQPDLTPAERAFSQEVSRMDAGINGPSGYLQLVDRLQSCLSEMRALARMSNPNGEGGARKLQQLPLTKEFLDDIENTLAKEQQNMEETCERIAELQIHLSDTAELS